MLVAYIIGNFLISSVGATNLGGYATDSSSNHFWITYCLACIVFVWEIFVLFVSLLGVYIVRMKYHEPAMQENDDLSTVEGVTILRPIKGIETEMEACLTCSFVQRYPKFEIIFCVENEHDPAVAIVRRLISAYPSVDAKLLVGDDHYGPNPKINNLVKGYKAAKYDIIWVLDSNVWVSHGTLARSVSEFCKDPRIMLVHHLPLALSIASGWQCSSLGGKLDEMFLFTSHSKFYSAINKVAIAPCVMGKSNLYRRSSLDTTASRYGSNNADHFGLQTFAAYIAEDNMIAEALWKLNGRTAMTSDSVIQPLGSVSFEGYRARRVRWLRVRRYMVFLATLIEPTTESLLSAVLISWSSQILFSSTGSCFSWYYLAFHMCAWCAIDYYNYHNLLSFGNVEHDTMDPAHVPYFVSHFYSPDRLESGRKRPFFKSWLPIWLLRECLALPIWIQAMCGHQIYWRNRPFRIKADLTAEEIRISSRGTTPESR